MPRRRQTVRDLLDALGAAADAAPPPEASAPMAPGAPRARGGCPHPAHAAHVTVHKSVGPGLVKWTVEASVRCSVCGSRLLFAGRERLLADAEHEAPG